MLPVALHLFKLSRVAHVKPLPSHASFFDRSFMCASQLSIVSFLDKKPANTFFFVFYFGTQD